MYCKKCGKEIKDGAVFCQYCGARVEHQTEEEKPVQDQMFKFRKTDENGDPIVGQQANGPAADDQGAPNQGGASGTGSDDVRVPYTVPGQDANAKKGMFGTLIKSFFAKPMETIEQSNTNDAFKSGLLFWLIACASTALFAGIGSAKILTFVIQLINQIETQLGSGSASSLYSYGYGTYGLETYSSGLGIGMFFVVLIVSMIAIIIWLLLAWLFGRAFGGHGTFKLFIATSGTASLYLSALMLLLAVMTAVSAGIGLFLLVFLSSAAGIMMNVCMVKALKESMAISWDKAIFGFAAGSCAYALLGFILTGLISLAN